MNYSRCYSLLILNKMEKTKLYFNFIRDFNDDIELIANNHFDLECYLISKFDFKNVTINLERNEVSFKKPNDTATYYGEIKWITHI
jgi:hypothetical protein